MTAHLASIDFKTICIAEFGCSADSSSEYEERTKLNVQQDRVCNRYVDYEDQVITRMLPPSNSRGVACEFSDEVIASAEIESQNCAVSHFEGGALAEIELTNQAALLTESENEISVKVEAVGKLETGAEFENSVEAVIYSKEKKVSK